MPYIGSDGTISDRRPRSVRQGIMWIWSSIVYLYQILRLLIRTTYDPGANNRALQGQSVRDSFQDPDGGGGTRRRRAQVTGLDQVAGQTPVRGLYGEGCCGARPV